MNKRKTLEAIGRITTLAGTVDLKQMTAVQAAQTLLADARTQNKIGNVSDADVRLMVELVQAATRQTS